MWLFPGLTYAVIVFIVAALTIMLFQEAHRVEILATGLLASWSSLPACWWHVVANWRSVAR